MNNPLEASSAQKAEFKSCFTSRSFLAIIYAIFVFTPCVIWLSLVTVGVTFAGVVEFSTLLIFLEFARLSGKPFQKQEAMVVFLISGLVGAGFWMELIYNEYFLLSPMAEGLGIVDLIPTWYAPPRYSKVWDLRTFFNPWWVSPIIVTVGIGILQIIIGIFFGLLARELFVEGEKLPFPTQEIRAQAVVTLTERHGESLNVLTTAAIPSFLYATVLYGVPIVMDALGYKMQILPIPWFDFTSPYIEDVFPGASFGIATDAILFSWGIFLPFNVVASMFLGSFFAFFVMNGLLVQMGLTAWATRWTYRMDIAKIWRESTLYFWASPVIGMSIAVGIAPILARPKFFIRIIKSLFKMRIGEGEDRISGPRLQSRIMLLLFSAVIPLIIVQSWLVPTFPIWILILYDTIVPLTLMMVTVRMSGVTGVHMEPPYLRELTILASGYQKYDVWFLPLPMITGSYWATNFKLSQLTETTPTSLLKLYALAWPLGLFVSFVYTSLFWAMAPIPSAIYPAPAITWPIRAIYQSVWIARPKGLFNPDLIIYFFAITAALSVAFELFRFPISMISFVVGSSQPIPIYMTLLIGGLVGQLLTRVLGRQWFKENRGIIAAGIALGEGIAVTVGSALALITRSIWMRPY